jgi:hypothetical protein
MIIHSNTNGTATLVVNLRELSLIDYALGCFQQFAQRPNAPYDPEDADLANAMEQACFKVFVTLSENESASRA